MGPTSPESLLQSAGAVVPRAERERRLGQVGRVIWFFGLSGAGKSTLGRNLERRLADRGFATVLLDGDDLRSRLNRGLGFSDDDRAENLRRAGEVARLFVRAGIVTLCCFITPRRENRAMLREIIGPADFLPVYVRASYEACASRDPKGLYAKARNNEIARFTGRDSEFEPPERAEAGLVVDTENLSVAACVEYLETLLLPQLQTRA